MKTFTMFRFCVLGLMCMLAWIGPARVFAEEEAGVEVMTRGPIHEAFAETVNFNPEAGIVVHKAPPEPIEELPPDQKPEGSNVVWIPGYWAWDDERNDFLWVSGTWRALPPGRQWMPGYWNKDDGEYQWISGYWADAKTTEVEYLPPPPTSIEVGANVAPPSADHIWVSGCWVWHDSRYAWRPGYWAVAEPEWVWIPAHYVWTPCGYVFIEGYWDYIIDRRGVLYAPIYFAPAVYIRHGYHYSPSICISVSVFRDHLFVRPRYCHYYFGDYYAVTYVSAGFYASFSFGGRVGCDPIFIHERWRHRGDRQWEARVTATFKERRDREDARPPRTFAAQQRQPAATGGSRVVAGSIDQVAKADTSPMRVTAVDKEEQRRVTQRDQDLHKFQDVRRTAETKVATPDKKNSKQAMKVKMAQSPLAIQSGQGQAPPKPLQAPAPDLKSQPPSDAQPVPRDSGRPAAPSLPDRGANPDPGPKPAPAPPKAEPRPAPTPAPAPSPPRSEPRPEPPRSSPPESSGDDGPPKSKDGDTGGGDRGGGNAGGDHGNSGSGDRDGSGGSGGGAKGGKKDKEKGKD